MDPRIKLSCISKMCPGTSCYLQHLPLLQNLGLAGFAGVAVMLVMGFVSGVIVNQVAEIRNEVFGVTDHRVSLMREIVDHPRTIKLASMVQLSNPAATPVNSSAVQPSTTRLHSITQENHFLQRVMEVRRRCRAHSPPPTAPCNRPMSISTDGYSTKCCQALPAYHTAGSLACSRSSAIGIRSRVLQPSSPLC